MEGLAIVLAILWVGWAHVTVDTLEDIGDALVYTALFAGALTIAIIAAVQA